MASALRQPTDRDEGPVGLSPAFSGEHEWCRERMLLTADLAEGMPLAEFFDGDGFRQAIDRYGEACGGKDRRAVVSMWSLYYFSCLAIPYLIARRLAEQTLPVAFGEMTIALAENGLPRAFGVPHGGDKQARPSLDDFDAVGPLLETHLQEAVARLKTSGISAKLCWNNAAVYIDYTLRLTTGHSPVIADLPLFIRGCLPDGGVNPFCGCVQNVQDDGEHVRRRKICCLRYMLPGVPSCGKICALPSQRSRQ